METRGKVSLAVNLSKTSLGQWQQNRNTWTLNTTAEQIIRDKQSSCSTGTAIQLRNIVHVNINLAVDISVHKTSCNEFVFLRHKEKHSEIVTTLHKGESTAMIPAAKQTPNKILLPVWRQMIWTMRWFETLFRPQNAAGHWGSYPICPKSKSFQVLDDSHFPGLPFQISVPAGIFATVEAALASPPIPSKGARKTLIVC